MNGRGMVMILASVLLAAVFVLGAGRTGLADVPGGGEQICCQIQGLGKNICEMTDLSLLPLKNGGRAEKFRMKELKQGRFPQQKNEIAVEEALLEELGVKPHMGNKLVLASAGGTPETFVLSGILESSETGEPYEVYVSENYEGDLLAERNSTVGERMIYRLKVTGRTVRQVLVKISHGLERDVCERQAERIGEG